MVDRIIFRKPVYLVREPIRNAELQIHQFSLRPSWRPYDDQGELVKVQRREMQEQIRMCYRSEYAKQVADANKAFVVRDSVTDTEEQCEEELPPPDKFLVSQNLSVPLSEDLFKGREEGQDHGRTKELTRHETVIGFLNKTGLYLTPRPAVHRLKPEASVAIHRRSALAEEAAEAQKTPQKATVRQADTRFRRGLHHVNLLKKQEEEPWTDVAVVNERTSLPAASWLAQFHRVPMVDGETPMITFCPSTRKYLENLCDVKQRSGAGLADWAGCVPLGLLSDMDIDGQVNAVMRKLIGKSFSEIKQHMPTNTTETALLDALIKNTTHHQGNFYLKAMDHVRMVAAAQDVKTSWEGSSYATDEKWSQALSWMAAWRDFVLSSCSFKISGKGIGLQHVAGQAKTKGVPGRLRLDQFKWQHRFMKPLLLPIALMDPQTKLEFRAKLSANSRIEELVFSKETSEEEATRSTDEIRVEVFNKARKALAEAAKEFAEGLGAK